jgi:hypothetical protein
MDAEETIFERGIDKILITTHTLLFVEMQPYVQRYVHRQ